MQELILNLPRWMSIWHESPSDYWFNQMYYGTHGPFKRAEAGQAITFENDKVRGGLRGVFVDWLTGLVLFSRLWFTASWSPTPILPFSTSASSPRSPTDWLQLSGKNFIITTRTCTAQGHERVSPPCWYSY